MAGVGTNYPQPEAVMPTFDAERFFDDTRDWQWIKHTIFAEYIDTWATIVGKWAQQIWIVDAFAGAGSFKAPDTDQETDGTPLLAARAIEAYNARHGGLARRCDLIVSRRAAATSPSSARY